MAQQKMERNLRAWFQKFGRDLPWRRTVDPYTILVSEIMLQQTQVKTVLRYFSRWMEKFPGIEILAKAPEDAVLGLWQGLGYYSRARNLHRAAKILAQLPMFPKTPAELKCLPGVGDYTAHAVVAFAFDACVPVVDANTARVLSRLFDYSRPVNTVTGIRDLREMAISLLPIKGGGRLHNSAIMELGALICKPRKPLCFQCPLRVECRARTPESRPVKRPHMLPQKVEDHRAFLYDEESIWLIRSSERWWVGLWILPTLRRRPSGPCDCIVKFSITRHEVTMRIWRCAVLAEDRRKLQKVALRDLEQMAMPAPHRRGVAAMVEMLHTGTYDKSSELASFS
ncbi:putative A/G-specific adenine glycosylase YfhQ [Candidatus Xiphinematobacter sp. Idaho Grape]|uniref:A/G-specific adenine glycosylase n=1 Tax=Candidatus Xiphinematobacter sp. Idaho Grape TaxID=1704307 RepID=UPI000705DC9A|nr:A/G-specific adenine glycosylase [Candidatus Xiphinematobacter sp. Idaho Grape]ALJ56246.1 putative A/G-specific adenine glycosylase YfhQ [Candidatus Xiphinematobacter sp. Idaho Grape]